MSPTTGRVRVLCATAGCVLLAASVVGGAGGLLLRLPPAGTSAPAVPPAGEVHSPVASPPAAAGGEVPDAAWDALPITRVRVPRIRLDSRVVPAPLVAVPEGTTWEVPPHQVGHAAATAGAGAAGNAVLLGHVSSTDAGSVFRDLADVAAGDTIEVFSGARAFAYHVVEVRTVPRTDVAALAPRGDVASLSLVTCAGVWLPRLQDYSERLVVRAELLPQT